MARSFGNKRKAFIVVAATLAIIALSATFVLASHDFPDVSTGAFYHDDVSWLVDNGITSGCGGGKYCPNNAVTRGQMAVFLHKSAPYLSLVETNGSATDATVSSTYEQLDDLDSFSKAYEGTTIKLTWTDHVATGGTPGTSFCDYQVRVDGDVPDADARAVNYDTEQAVELTEIFSGLAAGSHDLTLWVRGNGTSCSVNHGNFTQSVLVEEFGEQ
jgi:hypothetical protein